MEYYLYVTFFNTSAGFGGLYDFYLVKGKISLFNSFSVSSISVLDYYLIVLKYLVPLLNF